jgi:hypothetical protein
MTRADPFRQFQYPTSPEQVHNDHIDRAWAAANQRVADRFTDQGR